MKVPNIELLNDDVDNLHPNDENIVAQGKIFVDGAERGCWKVRIKSQWSANLFQIDASITADSRDKLKQAIAEKFSSNHRF
ncbi:MULTISPECIES: hypothetical protein [unclassified Caballeronia]|uniref:hypothetical protein n=1 Tax=unclassified Caballeronia TaxID=2646786 RepID=UPI00285E114C|nr:MULTISPECIES: hypothetical protein [unclassified Caballeronia]MDR5763066.1 hypothetical protein [Caballeronia sp. LZ035]MDR5884192.1 hypothetical protein [Caballeronia sp. LZ032]